MNRRRSDDDHDPARTWHHFALGGVGSCTCWRTSADHRRRLRDRWRHHRDPRQRIRLFGIDAPESSQLCIRPNGERWRCGQQASFALADRIGRATVRCEQRDIDRYGRVVAVCFKGAEDLDRWMVRNGWAVAFRRYSLNYVADENTARQNRINIWSGEFDMPWDWRRQNQNR
jgi:endonuclease YncB( thermonuclease family)